MLVLEAASYDVVLIETVGVGQSETTVAGMVDTFVFLTLARTGDQLQGIKRGVLEIADLIAVNKADGDREGEARLAARELGGALRMVHGRGEAPAVVTCSGLTGGGGRRHVASASSTTEHTSVRTASPSSAPTNSSTSRGRWCVTSSSSGSTAPTPYGGCAQEVREPRAGR